MDRPKMVSKPEVKQTSAKQLIMNDASQFNSFKTLPHLSQNQQPSKLKIIAFNVNGLRSALSKGLSQFVQTQNPDVICFSETKIGNAKLPEFLKSPEFTASCLYKNYNYVFAASTLKQGYAGTAIFIKKSVAVVNIQNQAPEFATSNIINAEGRYILVNFLNFVLIHVYVPNSGRGDDGFLAERIDYEDEIRFIINKLQQQHQNIIYCGDLNVVAEKIDIHEWNKNVGQPGMTVEEQREFQHLKQKCNMIDSFRHLNPELVKYSWFSNFGTARTEKRGWRLDYFMVSNQFMEVVEQSNILDDINSLSDHTPILLQLQFK